MAIVQIRFHHIIIILDHLWWATLIDKGVSLHKASLVVTLFGQQCKNDLASELTNIVFIHNRHKAKFMIIQGLGASSPCASFVKEYLSLLTKWRLHISVNLVNNIVIHNKLYMYRFLPKFSDGRKNEQTNELTIEWINKWTKERTMNKHTNEQTS